MNGLVKISFLLLKWEILPYENEVSPGLHEEVNFRICKVIKNYCSNSWWKLPQLGYILPPGQDPR
jgi:hypothetical protein